MAKVFRFFNTRTGEHFYTADVGERNGIIATLPDVRYEGVGFMGNGANTVARFRRRDTGAHFYTASSGERQYIEQNLSDVYALESYVAFYGYETQESSALQPVYRFYDASSGSHFFTASQVERDAVAATMPNFRFEGVAFYVAQTPALPPALTGALDEDWYLRAYPDVRDAVNAGTITARTHYEAFGRAEGRMPNDMSALAGDDRWTAFDSAPGFVRVLNGGSGNDTLDGTDDHGVTGGTLFGGLSDYDDRLYGETGDDVLYGAQNDTLDGGSGSGNDTYYVHSSGVRVTEGTDAGIDTVVVREDTVSGHFNYHMPANVERMKVVASGPETVRPVFVGSDGDDWISAGSSTSMPIRVIGGTGNDTLNGGSGGFTLGAQVEGGPGDDYLLAVGSLFSRSTSWIKSGNDTLDGGDGNDTLVAWSGEDRLTGGAGADTFLVDMGTPPNLLWKNPDAWTAYPTGGGDTTSWGDGTTTVTDFQPGVDVLSFRYTTLSLDEVMARFQDRAGETPAVQASFSTAELGLVLPSYQSPGTFTIALEGLTKSQMSASWFLVSSS